MGNFEKSSRLKLRFAVGKGNVGDEDLWDLPLTSKKIVSLDDLYKSLNAELKESGEESIIVASTKTNERLKLKFDIVTHIIKVKLAEKEKRENAVAVKAHNEKILAKIAKVKDAGLDALDEADLMKLLK